MNLRNYDNIEDDPIWLIGFAVAALQHDEDPEVRELGDRLDTLILTYFAEHPVVKDPTK